MCVNAETNWLNAQDNVEAHKNMQQSGLSFGAIPSGVSGDVIVVLRTIIVLQS